MGLDVQLSVINEDEFYRRLNEQTQQFQQCQLSRTFCNLLHRDDIIEHKSELSQISDITKIDLLPIEKMSWYCTEDDMKEQLGMYDKEDEKIMFINQTLESNKKVINNIDSVIEVLIKLIVELSKIDDLNSKLVKTNYDTLDNERYFSKFNDNLGDGYIDNNFGQDLRNLLRQIEFAKSIGETTVFFRWG